MQQTYPARRYGDGTIDFDFYRAQAAALRGQALRDSAILKRAGAAVAIALTLSLVVPGAAAAFRQINPTIALPAICSNNGAVQ